MSATRLVVAQVRGLHALHGVVRVEVLTDRPGDRFAVGQVLHREGSELPLTIVEAAAVEDGPGWRIRFHEVPDRSTAERLRDAYLETTVDRGSDLAPGAAYWHEVVGTEVKGLDHRSLGKVVDIYRVATAEVLVVRGGPDGEFDVPLVRDIVKTFEPERGEIVVDETVLDLGGEAVDPPRVRTPRRRPRWSKHGKGGAGGTQGPSTAVPGGGSADTPDAAPDDEEPRPGGDQAV